MKLVRESLIEGVGDVYAEKFGVPNELKRDYRVSTDAVLGYITKPFFTPDEKFYPAPIIKNPKSLSDIKPMVRGVLLLNGDLYVCNSLQVIHNDIIKFLYGKGLIAVPSYKNDDWNSMGPYESEFVSVQRVYNKDLFAVGESYDLFVDENPYIIEDLEKIINVANSKHSDYKFVSDNIREMIRNLPGEEKAAARKLRF